MATQCKCSHSSCDIIWSCVHQTNLSLCLEGGWKKAESCLTSKNTPSWMMLGVGSCVWRSSVQQRQILDSMSVRYETHIQEVYSVSRYIWFEGRSVKIQCVKCFVLLSFRMSLAVSSARQGCAPLMYRRLTSRTTNHRTCLPKVGQPDLLQVNILHTGWRPETGFSCGNSTLSLVQLCLRRDKAHAIVHFHFSSPHFWSRHPITSYDISLQQTATVCINFHFQPLPIIHSIRWCHVEILLAFSFYPFHTYSHHK